MNLKRGLKEIICGNSFLRNAYLTKTASALNKTFEGIDRKSVFEKIYKDNMWGGEDDYYSGEGSHNSFFVEPYVDLIRRFIRENSIQHVLDCGCGDFNVSSKWLDDETNYIGIDIFDELIEAHKRKYASEHRSFYCLDIVTDPLPDAQLCLVRQVFQHLKNEDVVCCLKKMEKYPYVIITEDRCKKDEAAFYNADIRTGNNTRTSVQSGLYFEESPFNYQNETILTIPYTKERLLWSVEFASVLIKNKT